MQMVAGIRVIYLTMKLKHLFEILVSIFSEKASSRKKKTEACATL